MTTASIDVGTNTVLLVVAETNADGTLRLIHHEQRAPRLGKDVDRERAISADAFHRISEIFREYQAIARRFGAERIVAAGTSAVRDASNRDEFVASILRDTGIAIDVLSGEEEAYWTYRGVLSGLPTGAIRPVAIDIGGGSTEVTVMPDDRSSLQAVSLQLGAVRLTERYFHHDPPLPPEVADCRNEIHAAFNAIRISGMTGGHRPLVAVSGTATTLACLDLGLQEFDASTVSGYALGSAAIERWCTQLLGMSRDAIGSLSRTTEGREDILAAGVFILSEFVKRYGWKEAVVCVRGLRHGLILRELERRRR